MRLKPRIIIVFSAILIFMNSCSIFSAENENPTIEFSSSTQQNLLEEGNIQIKIAEENQEITLTDRKPTSQQFTVSPDTFSFSFRFSKHDTTQPISQGETGLTLKVDKNYHVSFSSWKVDTTSKEYKSYGGCFECLKFNSFSINHSALDSTSSLFNHRLLITFVD